MTPALLADGLVVLIVLVAVVSGWRQGAFASVLSTIGVVAGLIVGAALAPPVMQLTDSVALRFLLGLGTVIMLVGLGNLIGGILGAELRDSMRMRASQTADSFIGSAFAAVTTLVVVWLVSIPLATGLSGPVGQGLRNSTILGFVDRSTPAGMEKLPGQITVLLDDSGFPPLFSPFNEPPAREVAAPNIRVEDTGLVEALRPSVVHIQGESQQCRRRLMGSGFVTGPDHVITNAHVVAGTQTVRLDTVLGMRDAEVVYYNPAVDIAVLRSPGLGLPVLPWADDPAASGDDAIVMGFPASGPFEAAPARVREKLLISGPDIYSTGQVEREAYTVRGSIRQGNSGGPMVDTQGRVLGVVFGASVDQTDTGYVVTAEEVRRQTGDVAALVTAVGTQGCVAR